MERNLLVGKSFDWNAAEKTNKGLEELVELTLQLEIDIILVKFYESHWNHINEIRGFLALEIGLRFRVLADCIIAFIEYNVRVLDVFILKFSMKHLASDFLL